MLRWIFDEPPKAQLNEKLIGADSIELCNEVIAITDSNGLTVNLSDSLEGDFESFELRGTKLVGISVVQDLLAISSNNALYIREGCNESFIEYTPNTSQQEFTAVAASNIGTVIGTKEGEVWKIKGSEISRTNVSPQKIDKLFYTSENKILIKTGGTLFSTE